MSPLKERYLQRLEDSSLLIAKPSYTSDHPQAGKIVKQSEAVSRASAHQSLRRSEREPSLGQMVIDEQHNSSYNRSGIQEPMLLMASATFEKIEP